MGDKLRNLAADFNRLIEQFSARCGCRQKSNFDRLPAGRCGADRRPQGGIARRDGTGSRGRTSPGRDERNPRRPQQAGRRRAANVANSHPDDAEAVCRREATAALEGRPHDPLFEIAAALKEACPRILRAAAGSGDCWSSPLSSSSRPSARRFRAPASRPRRRCWPTPAARCWSAMKWRISRCGGSPTRCSTIDSRPSRPRHACTRGATCPGLRCSFGVREFIPAFLLECGDSSPLYFCRGAAFFIWSAVIHHRFDSAAERLFFRQALTYATHRAPKARQKPLRGKTKAANKFAALQIRSARTHPRFSSDRS